MVSFIFQRQEERFQSKPSFDQISKIKYQISNIKCQTSNIKYYIFQRDEEWFQSKPSFDKIRPATQSELNAQRYLKSNISIKYFNQIFESNI